MQTKLKQTKNKGFTNREDLIWEPPKLDPPELFVVATPIGNINDMSTRAKLVLKDCEGVVCENQNTTIKLLTKLNINYKNKNFFRFGDFNNKTKVEDAISFIKQHKNIALVTEAGTPLISDPGYKLVSYIHQNKESIKLTPIPGPSALVTSLCVSGLPTDKFLFIGFLPKGKGKKQKILKNLSKIDQVVKTTFVIYESKYNLLSTLELINSLYPQSIVSISKELTKINETIFYGKPNNVLKQLNTANIKGEFVINLYLNDN